MKKLSLILVFTMAISCNDRPYVDPYRPLKPNEIPDTTCDGTKVEWNRSKERAYRRGKLYIIRNDSCNCIMYIVREID